MATDAETSCVFCQIAAGELPGHVVVDEPNVVAFLDRRPVFPGHVLVIPRSHHATFDVLPADLVESLFACAQRVARAVEAGLGADGAFVALNNKVSQSVAHVHVHVVPRRKGDGLKGFFWPRHNYANEAEAADFAQRVRSALAS